MSFFLPFTSVLLPAALILRCPKKRALQLICWWKSAPRAVAFFHRATSPLQVSKTFVVFLLVIDVTVAVIIVYLRHLRCRCQKSFSSSSLFRIVVTVVVIVRSMSLSSSFAFTPLTMSSSLVIVNVRYRRFHCCDYGRCLFTSLPSYIPSSQKQVLLN